MTILDDSDSQATRAAIYVRVSTSKKTRLAEAQSYDQNPAVQEQPLRELVTRRGWNLHKVYSDRASGAKESRPGLDALMADARRGVIHAVVVWRFDRFARSAKQLVMALDEFRSLGVDFVSHQEHLDTSSPMGKAMFTIVAAMAELERAIIRERVKAGLDYALTHGSRSGRPVGRPRVVFDREAARQLRRQGKSWKDIAREVRVTVAAVRRACQENCANRDRPV